MSTVDCETPISAGFTSAIVIGDGVSGDEGKTIEVVVGCSSGVSGTVLDLKALGAVGGCE